MAVKVLAVASPAAFVTALVVRVALANVPEAPEAGAVKVTVAPGTGLPAASLTSATSAAGKAFATVPVCGEPEEMTVLAAAPAVIVSELLVAELSAPAVAVSV